MARRAAGSRTTATAKRRSAKEVQTPARFPSRYSHAYPVHEGHDYVLNAIPLDVWDRAKKRAHGDDRSVRTVLITLLDLYGNGRLNL